MIRKSLGLINLHIWFHNLILFGAGSLHEKQRFD